MTNEIDNSGPFTAGSKFRDVADGYCRLITGCSGADWDGFRRKLRKTLANLIQAAYELPLVEPTDVDPPSVPDTEWRGVFDGLTTTLKVRHYWQVADRDDQEVVCGDLADDLADIWRDLQVGLRTPRDGDAIWEWRFAFHTHWGQHAIAALSVLHGEGQEPGQA
jgi:hypothetical protein